MLLGLMLPMHLSASPVAIAMGDYNPPTPPDPQQPDTTRHYLLTAEASPSRAGSTNVTSARYAAGADVYLSASANSGYRFVHWLAGDTVLSTDRSCHLTMPSHEVHCVAAFVYDPAVPDDPTSAEDTYAATHQLTVSCSPQRAGSTSVQSGRYAEGSTVSITAYANTGYRFSYWLQEGNILGTRTTLSWTMGRKDAQLEAVFVYDPTTPDDPESDERDTDIPLLQQTSLSLADDSQWNVAGREQEITVQGNYYGEAHAVLQYRVDDGAWTTMQGDSLMGSTSYSRNFRATLLTTGDTCSLHTLYIRALDAQQRASQPFVQNILRLPALAPIGLGELTYTGQPVSHQQFGLRDEHSGRLLWLADGQFAASYSNNVEVGEAQVALSGQFPYSVSETTFTFPIVPANISGDVRLSQVLYVYDGTPHMPEVSFTSQGRDLVEGTDYVISYQDNVEIGQGKVLVNGLGNYTGAATKTFSICATDSVWQQLVAFYRAMRGEQTWERVWNIALGAQASASLYGVTYSHGQVVGLSLPANGLTGPLSSTLAAFRHLTSLNLSGNHLTGNAGSVGQWCPALTHLDLSENALTDVSPMLPLSITSLDLSGQHPDTLITLSIEALTAERLRKAVPQICNYDHAAQDYQAPLYLRLTDSPSRPSWIMDYEVDGQEYLSHVSYGYNVYRGAQLTQLYADNMTDDCSYRIALRWLEGDANMDSRLDLADLQTIVNYINLNHAASAPFGYQAANRWPDYTINVQDVVGEVNLLLAQPQGQAPQGLPAYGMSGETQADAAVSMYLRDGNLCLYSTVPVAALDVTCGTSQSTGNPSQSLTWLVDERGFAVGSVVHDRCQRSIVFSAAGASLPAGEEIVLARHVTNAELLLLSLMAVDAEARPLTAVWQKPTGIETLRTDASRSRYFHLDGTPASARETGLLIQDNRIINKK